MAILRRYAEQGAERKANLDVGLARFLETCRSETTVHAVYVHGSFALGTVGPSSDLDLLVVRETALGQAERGVDLVLRARAGVPLDVLVVTPEEFDTELPTTTYGATIIRTMRRVDAT